MPRSGFAIVASYQLHDDRGGKKQASRHNGSRVRGSSKSCPAFQLCTCEICLALSEKAIKCQEICKPHSRAWLHILNYDLTNYA